jgi:type IV pilus assembly protein PilB
MAKYLQRCIAAGTYGEDVLLGHDNIQVDESKSFSEWLIAQKLIDSEKLKQIIAHQEQAECGTIEAIVYLGVMSDVEIAKAYGGYLSVDYLGLDDVSDIDMSVARTIPESIAERFNLVAVYEYEEKIVVAMTDPLDLVALDIISLKTKKQIHTVISTDRHIRKARDAVYHGSYIEEEHLRNLVKTEIARADKDIGALQNDIDDLLVEANIASGQEDAVKAPVIKFVDLLLGQAVKSKASDIHIEPQEKSMSIRMRVDGVLQSMVPPSQNMHSGVLTRIKILSQMNIAERRLPQDGRFKIAATGRKIDVRVSSIPTIYGEKIVMRILDKTAVNHDLDSVGFEPNLLEKLKVIVNQPHGITIVTGPTGSGKSTTLYSVLNYIKDPKKNITTVEDPVEYRLDGANQIQIKSEIELDFAISLRAILRQDPDIIFIGEIRDKETVEIAIKASLTGHLVLSTFHTNDAPSALTRLVYMGIDQYLLASTLNLVIAQRLVRRVCEHCKEPVEVSEAVLKQLGIDAETASKHTFYHGKGCGICNNTGYMGRMPIFEFLVMTPAIRELVISGASENQIRSLSRESGYGGLLDSGVKKILEGKTTTEEIIKTAYIENSD